MSDQWRGPYYPGPGAPAPGPWRRFRATPVWVQALAWVIAVLAVLVTAGAVSGPKNAAQVSTATTAGGATTTTTTVPAEVITPGPPQGPAPADTTTAPPTTTATTTATTVAPTTTVTKAPPTTTTTTTGPAPTTTTTRPAATTTSTSIPTTGALCGAPANPFGYNFCRRGTFITSPNPVTCSYFNCIPNWSNGKGYMEECQDGTYSMSGGRSGSCSSHGGDLQPVYSGP